MRRSLIPARTLELPLHGIYATVLPSMHCRSIVCLLPQFHVYWGYLQAVRVGTQFREVSTFILCTKFIVRRAQDLSIFTNDHCSSRHNFYILGVLFTPLRAHCVKAVAVTCPPRHGQAIPAQQHGRVQFEVESALW